MTHQWVISHSHILQVIITMVQPGSETNNKKPYNFRTWLFYGATIILSCNFQFANLWGFQACFICTSVAFLLLELGVYHCCETHGTPEVHCCRRYRRIVAREIQKNPTFVRWHLMTAPTWCNVNFGFKYLQINLHFFLLTDICIFGCSGKESQ